MSQICDLRHSLLTPVVHILIFSRRSVKCVGCFSSAGRTVRPLRVVWRKDYLLPYIVGWMQEYPISAPDSRTTYLGARLKNALSWRPVQERPISAPGSRTTYLGTRLKNNLPRRPVEGRPISASGSKTTYLKRDFCFSDL